MYFVFTYDENRRMKTVEIVLGRGGGENRTPEGKCLTNIYHKHIPKYYTVSPCITIMC
jgi:hypothetical protein